MTPLTIIIATAAIIVLSAIVRYIRTRERINRGEPYLSEEVRRALHPEVYGFWPEHDGSPNNTEDRL